MLTLFDTTYKNLARMLISRIGPDEFFNGTVHFSSEDVAGTGVPDKNFDLTFRSTLLVYRSRDADRTIVNVVPVWWECATVIDSGPVLNDFDWALLREALLAAADD